MATILSLLQRVQSLNVNTVSQDTMEEAAPIVESWQRDQLLGGKNREGKKIGRYRNPAYAQMKHSMNAVPGLGVPDLRLTGDFYRGIYTDVRGDKIIIDSTDEKTQDLVDKYGEVIFGLSKDTKKEAVKDIRPIFMQNVRKAVKL